MKKIFIAGIFAALAIFTGCQKEDTSHYNEIQVSKSYVSLPVAGGTSTITLKATDAWAVKVKDKDKDVAWASWLTVSPLSGAAGEVTLTFSAEANEGKNADVVIECAGKAQHVNVIQGVAVVSEKTCKEVNSNDSPEGKTYRVTGVCTKIAEFATYGNWYINDGTLEGDGLYIYGTKYNGQTKQAAITKLGIEVGDVITIEGPKSIYNGTVELVDVDVVKVVKSLCKVLTESVEIGKEGGEVEIKVLAKGGNLNITPSDSWIKIAKTDIIKKQGKDPMDTTLVVLAIDANVDDVRMGKVDFTSGTSTVSTSISQASGLDCYPLPYEETFENGIGAWTVSDVIGLESGDVWFHDSTNKYMKASGYVGGANNETESDLISPRIDLTSATAASLSFDHAAKYGASLDDEFTLWISKDSGESWSQILIPVYTDKKSWNFVTNTVSLTPYVGNQVLVKFKYKSYTTGGSTLEVKNVSIKAEEVEVKNIAQLQGLAINKDTKSDFTATLTDALVTYVNGSNVFIQDATGGVLLYKSGHGFNSGDKIDGTVSGQITIYGGFAELTEIDVTSATVTPGCDVIPTVITIDELLKTFPRHMSCQIKLEGVTLDADLGSNRNANVKQGESVIAAYAKVKNTVTIAKDVEGDLICYPCINNTPDKIQVGIWEAGHFTAK